MKNKQARSAKRKKIAAAVIASLLVAIFVLGAIAPFFSAGIFN